jgi:predicted nuclease of predicted toxin-antitoxin system
VLAKIDENVPVEVATALNGLGWDCETVYQERLEGCTDDALADACGREQRILLTFDKDFGDKRFEEALGECGLILLRLPIMPISQIVDRILKSAAELESQLTSSRFVVVDENRIRKGRWIGPSAS